MARLSHLHQPVCQGATGDIFGATSVLLSLRHKRCLGSTGWEGDPMALRGGQADHAPIVWRTRRPRRRVARSAAAVGGPSVPLGGLQLVGEGLVVQRPRRNPCARVPDRMNLRGHRLRLYLHRSGFSVLGLPRSGRQVGAPNPVSGEGRWRLSLSLSFPLGCRVIRNWRTGSLTSANPWPEAIISVTVGAPARRAPALNFARAASSLERR